MAKDEKKGPVLTGKPETKAGSTPCAQIQKALDMVKDGGRFKNVNPEDVKKLADKSVEQLFTTPEGRKLLAPIPNKIVVIKADNSETQVPVFINPELRAVSKPVTDAGGVLVPHFRKKKTHQYVSIYNAFTPGANEAQKKVEADSYEKNEGTGKFKEFTVAELPLIGDGTKDGETTLVNINEMWQQWNKSTTGQKGKKPKSKKSKTAMDPVSYCDTKIAEAKTPEEKQNWVERKKVIESQVQQVAAYIESHITVCP